MTQTRKYSTGEEFANSLTHSLGALFAIYATVKMEASSQNLVQSVSVMIFGVTLFLLFLSSFFYHATRNEAAKKIFQKIDHAAIYLLISGTYTPALLLTVKAPLSVILLAIIWSLSIVGIVFDCTKFKSKALSTGLYLLMGWLAIFFVYNVWMASHLAVWLMLGGGLFYSLGCIFYLMKIRYMHSIWHLFVLAGAGVHYLAIVELLKAANY